MTLSDAARRIAGQAKPVLCLDTCVYLDVLNRAFSGQQVLAEIARYENLFAQGAFHAVIPAVVADEFARNVDAVTDRAKKEIRDAVGKWTGLRPVMHTATGNAHIAQMDQPTAEAAVDYLKNKSNTLLGLALPIEPDTGIHASASRRECAGRRPAQRGKNSNGDCLICETMLALATALRNNGIVQNVIFVSTNINDFGDDRPGMHGRIHPDLVPEFTALGIQYEPVLAATLWRSFP